MSRIEKLQTQPWYIQFVLFGLMACLIYVAFWYFVTRDMRAATEEVNVQVAALQQQNESARVASQRINEFRAAYERAQSDYSELRALLPEQRELTNVLQHLQSLASNRLSVRRFSPKEDTQQESFSAKPIEIEVSGTYNNLGAFFAQMAALQRIVSISDFTVTRAAATTQDPRNNISAQFLLTAYYVSAERLQSAPPGTPGSAPATASPATPPATAPAR